MFPASNAMRAKLLSKKRCPFGHDSFQYSLKLSAQDANKHQLTQETYGFLTVRSGFCRWVLVLCIGNFNKPMNLLGRTPVHRWTTPFASTFDMLCFGAPSGRNIHDRRRISEKRYKDHGTVDYQRGEKNRFHG